MISDFRLLVAIAEMGGLAAAGRELGLSPASVSERLAAIERHFGARLVNRTTRSSSLTEEGRLALEGARRIVAETDDLERRIRAGVEMLSGPVRLSAPFDLGRRVVSPLLDRFLQSHPSVEIELRLTDGYVDLVGTGLDFAIRFGALQDSALRMRRIGENRRIVCASPDYVSRRGAPAHPEDLKQHDCVLMRFGETIDREWQFNINGRPSTVMVSGKRVANDGALVRTWCEKGWGIALKSMWDIQDEIVGGKLVPLLLDFLPPPSSLQVVYAANRSMPRRTSALVEFLLEELSKAAPHLEDIEKRRIG